MHRATASGAFLPSVRCIGIGAVAVIVRRLRLRRRLDQSPDGVDPVAADAIGEEARMANAVEAGGQDMDQEAADELRFGQAHHLHPVAALDPVVLPPERHRSGVGADEAVVRDRDAVGVAAEIGQHRLRPAEGRLGVDDPVGLAQRREMGGEGVGVGQFGQAAEE